MIRRYLFPFPLLLFAVLCHAQTPDATPAAGPTPAAAPALAPSPPPVVSQPAALSLLPQPLRDAQELVRARKFAEAESAYNAILQANPKSALAYAGLTHLYLRQDRVADAEKSASKASELSATSEAARVAMGEVRFRRVVCGMPRISSLRW
jgi:tetratricopeptide (TPR) repeat protein